VSLEKTAVITEIEVLEEFMEADEVGFIRSGLGLEPDTDLWLVDSTTLHLYKKRLEGDTSEEAEVLARLEGAADDGHEVLF